MFPEENKNYEEMYQFLKPLGFYKTDHPGLFGHHLSKMIYDFTAASLEGIPFLILQEGIRLGKEQKIKEIKNILDI